MVDRPNLIERLEEANAMCEELRAFLESYATSSLLSRVEPALANIEGVIGEVLTMVDGR